jgi:cell wall-associated NlpC family hydrolase
MFYGNAFGNLTTAYTNKTYLRGSVNSATETALAESINGLMNIPYVWGGSSKKGTDCSGFTQQVYKNLGVNLPRTSGEQYKSTTRVNSSEL